MTIAAPVLDELKRRAREASARAYAPYSKFAVGAAVLTGEGEIHIGANVENASYGLSICAERNAVFHAIAQGARTIEAVVVYTPTLRARSLRWEKRTAGRDIRPQSVRKSARARKLSAHEQTGIAGRHRDQVVRHRAHASHHRQGAIRGLAAGAVGNATGGGRSAASGSPSHRPAARRARKIRGARRVCPRARSRNASAMNSIDLRDAPARSMVPTDRLQSFAP